MKSDLLEEYIKNIRKWSQATLSDDSSAIKATVHYGKKSDKIIGALKSVGRSHEILIFLQDPDPGVRFGVASHAMRFDIAPEVTLPVFQSLLNDPSAPLAIRIMIRNGIQTFGLEKT